MNDALFHLGFLLGTIEGELDKYPSGEFDSGYNAGIRQAMGFVRDQINSIKKDAKNEG